MKVIVLFSFQVYYKSSSSRRREETRHLANYKYIIHPFSIFALQWEYLVSIVYTILFIFLSIITAYRNEDLSLGLLYFKFSLNVFLTADMVKIFFTGYYDSKNSKTVMQARLIAWYYLKTYFIPDLMCSMHG